MNKETIKTTVATAVLAIMLTNAVIGLYEAAKLVRKENKIKKNANKED